MHDAILHGYTAVPAQATLAGRIHPGGASNVLGRGGVIMVWGCLGRGRCYFIPAGDVLVAEHKEGCSSVLSPKAALRAQARCCRAASSLPFGGERW